MGFLRGFSIAAVANVLMFVLSFLTNKLLYMSLSPRDNGIYFLVIRYALLLTLVLGEWLRLTNINLAGRDNKLNTVLASNCIVYTVGVGIIFGALFLLFPGIVGVFFPGLPKAFLWAVILTGLLLLVRNSFQSLLLVNNLMLLFGSNIVLWGLCILVLDGIFIVIMDLGLTFAVLALFISSLIAALWAVIANVVSFGYSLKPSLRVFGMSGKLGMRSAGAVVGVFLLIYLPAFSIEPLAGSVGDGLVTVGIFSVCFRIFQLFQRGSDVTGSILYAQVARQTERSGYRVTKLVSRNLIMLSLLFSVIGGVLGKYLIIIIADSTYLDAFVPFLLMLPGIVAINVGSVINGSYWGRGYPLKVIIPPYIAGLVGLVMNIHLIPRYGASGAAFSFSVSGVMWFVYMVEIFRRDTAYSLGEIVLPRFEDAVYVYSRTKQFLAELKK